jgi:hypothetical protein
MKASSARQSANLMRIMATSDLRVYAKMVAWIMPAAGLWSQMHGLPGYSGHGAS